MKLISLNTWGGRAGKDKLLDFFARYRDVDIFCLQEIYAGPFPELEGTQAGGKTLKDEEVMVYGRQEIAELLKNDHVSFFDPHFLDIYGLMLLVKKGIPVISQGDIFVYREKGHVPSGDAGNHARNIQYVTIQTVKGPVTLVNFHGLWNGGGKGDSDDRLLQSDRIIDFFQSLKNPYIFCGDFNLKPDTESLKKFETLGFHNLIKEYGITSTRTSLYTKEEKFADYTFVSNGIMVKDFKVLPDEVSDHAAMYLEFD